MAGERRSVRLINSGDGSYFHLIPVRTICFGQILFVLVISLSGVACGFKEERRGIPPEVEAVIATVTEDIAAERYEKIYNEASDLWRRDLTLDQSVSAFKTLNAKLGKPQNRVLHSATEQHNSGGSLEGEAFIITYQVKFERGEGMETFTLLKRDQRWLLARYFVNSTALK